MPRTDFEPYWQKYLLAHDQPKLRSAHGLGKFAGFASIVFFGLGRRQWRQALGLYLLFGYLVPGASHPILGRNLPMAFRGNLGRALRADYRLTWRWFRGSLDGETHTARTARTAGAAGNPG